MGTKYFCVRSIRLRHAHRTEATPTSAYSSDSVYLYSTKDDPQPTSMASAESALLRPNSRHRSRRPQSVSDSDTGMADEDAMMDEDIDRIRAESTPSPPRTRRPVVEDATRVEDPDTREDVEEDEEDESEEHEEDSQDQYSKLPTIMPRSRYRGACNVETVKDGTFISPINESADLDAV